MADISMSQSTFAGLILKLLTPAPDDDGRVPWPFRPRVLGRGPFPDPWDGGPVPEPWRVPRGPVPWTPFDELADVLERVVHLADVADAGGSADKAVSTVEKILSRFVDDQCETPWRKGPRPPPKPRDLLMIGALLEIRSEDFQGGRLGKLLSNTSAKFLEVGLKRLSKEKPA